MEFIGSSPSHSPFPLGRALTVPAHFALCRKPRSARARCGRLLLLRPLVSGALLPPPASPTAPACKRPMTAFPCPSRSHLHPLSHASLQRLSTGASRPSATRPAGPRASRSCQWSPPSTSPPAGRSAAALAARSARRSTTFLTVSDARWRPEAAASVHGSGAPERLEAVQGWPQHPCTLGGRLEDGSFGWVGASHGNGWHIESRPRARA